MSTEGIFEVQNSHVLLYGTGGSGKSSCIASLLKLREHRPGMRVVILTTDLNARSGIAFGLELYKITPNKDELYVATIDVTDKTKAFSALVRSLTEFAKDSVSATYTTDKDSNANKDKYRYYIDVCKGLEHIKAVDYVTHEEVKLGNIGMLRNVDILIIDSLSPVIRGMWTLLKGDRLISVQNDYQVIQNQLTLFTETITRSLDCGFIMLAHEERDANNMIRPAINCGQKLHGTYSGMYTDVVYAYKTAVNQYFIAGRRTNTETVARNLPFKDNLVPDLSLYNLFRKQEDK